MTVLLTCAGAFAQDGNAGARKRIKALRTNPTTLVVDGHLNDPIWQKAEFSSGFTQKDPSEGTAAVNKTEVAIVYDDQAVYIAARLLCAEPDKILATVSRRDNVSNSERIVMSLDTYHDKRTAYTFGITASGVRVDYYHGSDEEYNRDYGWDPVWQAKAVITPDGWTAEMRIPFTQLRFNNQGRQTWGVNFNRWVPTTNEDSYWVLVPKSDTGWSSRMGEIVGIEGIQPSRRVEFLPYAASDVTMSDVDSRDPFRTDTDTDVRMGGDLKMGVGPNLTLEATINPDFGQVEADPAEVNLSAFETFFDERRPFFTEGANLLEGGGSGYFYSRRIGARPTGDPGGDFADVPDNTSILGAVKLTGRLNSGLSVGVLGAVTEEEKGRSFDLDSRKTTEEMVEPLTGYGVVRLQQEFGANQSTAGLIFTGVGRNVVSGDPLADALREHAFAGGGDWNLRFQEGKYRIGGSAGFSHIRGTRQAITNAQQTIAHNFQRPDNGHVSLDTTATSMTGWVARTYFEKLSGDHWRGGVGGGMESPKFEINDLGQIETVDDIESWYWVNYRENTPGKIFQSYNVENWGQSGWNFGGDRQHSFMGMGASMQYKNFMSTWLRADYNAAAQSDNLTRGGPSMGYGYDWKMNFNLNSNNKGKTTWWIDGSYGNGETGGWFANGGGSVSFKPGDRWELSVRPRYSRSVSSRQYVGEFENGSAATFGTRYVFAFVERSQLVAQTRLNYAFTPDLTLELYAEPFTASGRFYDFGELTAARSKEIRRYGTDGTTITLVDKDDFIYQVTDGGDPPFEIERPDFNEVSFRSNLVLRWEWSPGSTLFVVWQQNRSDVALQGGLVRPGNFLDALSAEGDSFLAVKLTYWIPFL